MLEHLGETDAAKVIENGIAFAVSQMKGMAAGEMGMGTDAVGDMVANFVAQN
jgi:isocitrate/isopropylmalate dehydrogenase